MVRKIDLSNFLIVVLAAGYGKRMGIIGKKYPKCLLKIGSSTLLKIIINILKRIKFNKIFFILGYKSNLIINSINNENIKFNYLINGKFKQYGHAYSWYLSQKQWNKEKKKTLILHADIFFDEKYIINILKSKIKNIIGSKTIINNSKKNIYRILVSKKNKILKISKSASIKFANHEVIGINKLSILTQKKLYKFMSKEFKNKKKLLMSWEDMLNNFIKSTNANFSILKNQNYKWINVNTIKDYAKVKKIFRNKII